MTPADVPQVDWEQIQGLLEQALLLPIHERAAWLERLPAAQDSLKEPLRRLLEVQAGLQTRPFLDGSSTGKDGLTPPATVLIGDLVGPYRLLQQLGDGGMGSVWLAERADGTLKRKVALKLPRMVWARDLATRMARERDILSSLEHPNIARLYDAGVDQLGRPFLALEYVEGHRIDQYCDAERLSIRERIRLFLQVLDAVQYAHTNLVLHRDLKPGNVLVNQRGEVRLLDFGIAKLLGDETGAQHPDPQSRSMSRAMTPRYASPEQVRQQRLALPSDVYSLGVMLYELLVGASPLIAGNGSRAELEIAIMEGQLRTPSRAKADESVAERRQTTAKRMSRAMRGELDAVLMKALAKSPADRYPTAEALRSDLVRWLDGHPVRAKPPSRILMIKKFVARNAWSVGLGSAAVSAIIATALVALYQAREARLESQRAAATRDFLLGLFENANPELHGGRELTARDLLGKGEAVLPSKLNSEPEVSADVLRAMANAWAQLGDYEKMRLLSSKRSSVLEKSTDRKLYIRALIDEGEVAARFSDVKTATIIVKKINIERIEKRLPTGDLADLNWIRGWIEISNNSASQALINFKKSLIDARTIGDSARELSALYGIFLSHARLGDRARAIETYQLAMRRTKKSDVSQGEKIRRRFEMLIVLFDMGEYQLGWKDISLLLEESISLYGLGANSQEYLYIYWMNWALRVGELARAEDFQSRVKKMVNVSSDYMRADLDAEWNRLEVRLLIQKNQINKAAVILRRIQAAQAGAQGKHYKDLLEAEILIRSGRPRDAVMLLGGDGWLKLEKNRDLDSLSWRIYKDWMTGVALIKLGNCGDAKRLLSDALIAAKNRFGSDHPRTALVTMNYVFSTVCDKGGDLERFDRSALYKSAALTLEKSYPASSPVIAATKRIGSAMEIGDEEGLFSVVAEYSQSTPFL